MVLASSDSDAVALTEQLKSHFKQLPSRNSSFSYIPKQVHYDDQYSDCLKLNSSLDVALCQVCDAL